MMGEPLENVGLPGRGGARVSALASATAFAGSLAALYLGYTLLALGLWLASGAAAAALVGWGFRYYEAVRGILASRGLEGELPRPLVGGPVAVAATLAAPPLAGLMLLAAYEGLLGIAEALYPEANVEEAGLVSRFQGAVPDLSGPAAASVLPLLLPVLAGEASRAVPAAACLVLFLAASRGLLGGKACRHDLVDVVVWSEPPGAPLDLEFVAEKWGVED